MSESAIISAFQKGEREQLDAWLRQRLAEEQPQGPPSPTPEQQTPSQEAAPKLQGEGPQGEIRADKPGMPSLKNIGLPPGARTESGADPLFLARIKEHGGEFLANASRAIFGEHRSLTMDEVDTIFRGLELPLDPEELKKVYAAHKDMRLEDIMRVIGEIAADPSSYVAGAPGGLKLVGAIEKRLAQGATKGVAAASAVKPPLALTAGDFGKLSDVTRGAGGGIPQPESPLGKLSDVKRVGGGIPQPGRVGPQLALPSGEPTVYHGTNATYPKLELGVNGEGVWVAENPATANYYANPSAQHPQLKGSVGGSGIPYGEGAPQVRPYTLSRNLELATEEQWQHAINVNELPASAREALQKEGYQGVMFPGEESGKGPHYLVFDPVDLTEKFTGQAGGYTAESFQKMLQSQEYVILSAEKTGLADNATRTAALEKDLLERGYHPIPGDGSYGTGNLEKSFVVPGMSADEGLTLASKYDQESIVTSKGLVFTADRSVHPSDLSKIDFSGAQEDYFTKVNIGGQDLKFTIPIDFEQKMTFGGQPVSIAAVQVNGYVAEPLGKDVAAATARLHQQWEQLKLSLTNEAGQLNIRGEIDIAGAWRKNKQLMNDISVVGAAHLWSGIRSFSEWSAKMTEQFGAVIQPFLKELYTASQAALKKMIGTYPQLPSLKNIASLEAKGAYARDWYDGALAEAERYYGPNGDLYLKVYAATSPRQEVTANFTAANKAMEMILSGERNSDVLFKSGGKDGFMGSHVRNLNRILRGEPLSGPKVGEFYPALQGDRQAVVVDSWMGRAFGMVEKRPEGWQKFNPTPKSVLFVQNSVTNLAQDIGVDPRGSQAAIWAAFKTLDEGPQEVKAFREVMRMKVSDERQALSVFSKETLDSIPAWVNEEGKTNLAMLSVLGRASVGAFVGGTTGDDPESRFRNALIGAGVGSILSGSLAKKAMQVLMKPEVASAMKNAMTSEAGGLKLRFPRWLKDRPSPNTEYMGAPDAAKRIALGINEKLLEAKKLARAFTVSHDETIAAALTSKFRNLEDVLTLDAAAVKAEDLAATRTAARGVRDFVLEDYLETAAQASLAKDPALAAEARTKFLLAGRVSQQVTDFETQIARGQEAGKITSRSALASKYNLDQLALDLKEMDAALAATLTDQQLIDMTTKLADRAATAKLAETASLWPKALWNIYYGLNLFSSPLTQAKNILGDIVGTMMPIAARGVAEGFELAMSPFTLAGARKPSIAFGETYDLVSGAWEMVADSFRAGKEGALQIAARNFQTGESMFFGASKQQEMLGQMASKNLAANVEGNALPKVIDVMSTLAEKNLRFMGGTDEFFKVLQFNGELKALARRQAMNEGRAGRDLVDRVTFLIDHPDKNMLAQATAYAHENTYTKAFDPENGGWRNLWGLGGKVEQTARNPLMRVMLTPVFRTPARLAEYSMVHTPGLNLLSVQFASDLAAGGAKAELAFSKLAVGSAVMGLAGWYAVNGYVTGDWPKDLALKAAYERTGWKPFSIYNPWAGTYHSYAGVEPLSTILGTTATMAQLWPEMPDHDVSTVAMAFGLAAANSSLNNPYVQAISDVGDIISGMQRGESVDEGLKYLAKRTASLIPGAALTRALASSSDDVQRENKTVAEAPPELRELQIVVNTFRAQYPGWSQTRPAKMNMITGEPIPNEKGWMGMFLPFQLSTNKNDPVLNELVALDGAGLPKEMPRVVGGVPPKGVTSIHAATLREGVLLSDPERTRLTELLTKDVKDPEGRTLYETLHAAIVGPGWEHDQYMDQSETRDGGKALFVRRTFNAFLREAEHRLLDEYPNLDNIVQRRKMERSLGRLPSSLESMRDPMMQMIPQR